MTILSVCLLFALVSFFLATIQTEKPKLSFRDMGFFFIVLGVFLTAVIK